MDFFALVEDDLRYSYLIKEELKLITKSKIIIDVNNGFELLMALNKTKKTPDILLLDIQLPKIDGLLLTQYIKFNYPQIKIIGISSHCNESLVSEVLNEGAQAFISKLFINRESAIYQNTIGNRNILFESIQSIKKGDTYIDELLINNSAKMRLSVTTSEIRNKHFPNLTKNQIEFLILNAADLSFEEISEIMQIGKSSIKNYYNQLAKYFEIHSRTELITFSIKRGLIKLPSYYDKFNN